MTYSYQKKLIKEYFDVIGDVSDAYDVDMGIAVSIMLSAVRNHTTAETKGVPIDFDWAEFDAKYKEYKAEC